MGIMTGEERIRALTEGGRIDRTPVGGWYHMPLVDKNVTDFTRMLIASTDFNHWDFIKIMTNGNYYTEAFGGKIQPSTVATQWCGKIEKYPIESAEDAAKLPVLDVDNPVFDRELKVLKNLKRHYGDSIPLIATIFNPLTAVQECAGCLDPGPIKKMMKEDPEALHKALRAMTKTNQNYLDALFNERIDGIFLANQYAMSHILTEQEYDEFCEPYERQIIEYCKGKTWFNMIHAHGNANLRMDRYYGYGNDVVQALNWENCPADTKEEDITRIADVRQRTDKVIIAGIDQDHDFLTANNDREEVKSRLVARFRTALKENGDNRFVFAPGCALLPGGTYLNSLIYEVAEEYGRS